VLHNATSKVAVIGMICGQPRELGRDNIRVNAIAPSAVARGVEFLGERLKRGLDGRHTPLTLSWVGDIFNDSETMPAPLIAPNMRVKHSKDI
jgi:NAD(P)-dependent dehydrogenase (short-subunit alcohol dehydrogenase family)